MICVLDYGAGNLTSVARSIRHLGHEPEITRDPERLRRAERIVFPGVGAAGASMDNLRRHGLDASLREALDRGTPILGICIGCQVAFTSSEEDGGTPCLGLVEGEVVRFRFPPGAREKIPHMGWNEVSFVREHPVTASLPRPSHLYFVHGYHVRPKDPAVVLGTTRHGGVEFVSAISRRNLVAVQFHPEKSGPLGLELLANFLRWNPEC